VRNFQEGARSVGSEWYGQRGLEVSDSERRRNNVRQRGEEVRGSSEGVRVGDEDEMGVG
jgi:hypothetical protein